MAALLVLQHELKKQNEQLRKDVMALEGEVLGALHHGVEDPSSIWRTTVGEVVAMRDELVLLVQVWELASPSHSRLLLPVRGSIRRVCADN